MASSLEPTVLTYAADAAITKGWAVKIGTDKNHVAKAAATTNKTIGIAQSSPTSAEDAVEVCVMGGCKGLLSGTVSAGMLLTATTDGSLVKIATAGDRIIARAMQDGVSGDLIDVIIAVGQAYQTES